MSSLTGCAVDLRWFSHYGSIGLNEVGKELSGGLRMIILNVIVLPLSLYFSHLFVLHLVCKYQLAAFF